MHIVKADTEVIILIGPAVAVGDGFTPVTTLVITGGGAADEAELLKHGSATVVDIAANTFAAVTTADGYYALTITTGNTDTEGMITVLINDDSLILPLVWRGMVMKAQVFDSFFGSDVLQTDVIEASATQAEPAQGNPGATISFMDKIGFMYKSWRNKQTNDGSTIELRNDADSATDHKATVSEAAGTVTRDEWVSGP